MDAVFKHWQLTPIRWLPNATTLTTEHDYVRWPPLSLSDRSETLPNGSDIQYVEGDR